METLVKISIVIVVLVCAGGSPAPAHADVSGGAGPAAAPSSTLPSHAPNSGQSSAGPQLAFHFGLLQPVLFEGMNAAIDLRLGRWLFSYSHGHALNYGAQPELGLAADDRRADLSLRSPWTTGGGVGYALIDELYVMVDFKVHRYQASTHDARADYTTASLGAELGYRLFAWKGLFVQPMLRYWPNIWTSLARDRAQLGEYRHEAKDLGVFANISIGWASSL